MIIKDWKRVFGSMNYFLKLMFFKKNFDVVFVSSTSFNRGENGEIKCWSIVEVANVNFTFICCHGIGSEKERLIIYLKK